MSRFWSTIAVLLAVTPLAAAAERGYYRQPALHGDTIIFSSEGDLWRVGVEGGLARRLTTHPGVESDPVVSRDGRRVAFVAQYEGGSEIYAMPATGGLPTRLTYDAAPASRTRPFSRTRPVSWTSDGRVVYATQSHGGLPDLLQLVLVDPDELQRERVPLAQASQGVFDAAGETIFFTRLPFNGSHAKRYAGGIVERLWRFRAGDPEATPITGDYDGTSRDPMVWDGRVYFASDRDGTMNIWSITPEGDDPRQHTRHQGFDVLGPSLDGGRIAYQLGADLRLLDLETGRDAVVPIDLASDFDQSRELWIDKPLAHLSSAVPTWDGRGIVLTVRGEVFVAPIGGGRVERVTRDSGVRYRDARPLPDAERMLAFADASGELELWSLPRHGTGEPRQITSSGAIVRTDPVVSPDGGKVAVADVENTLWIIDVATGAERRIVQSEQWFVGDLEWSPDGRFLVCVLPEAHSLHSRLWLVDAASGAMTALTTERYSSFAPSFDPDGGWLYFLSERNLESIVSSPWGLRQPEPFFDRPVQAYALALRPGKASPFLPETELDRAAASAEDDPASEDAADDAATEDARLEPIEIDLDGIASRLVQVPIPAGNHERIFAANGWLYWVARDDEREPQRTLRAIEIGPVGPGDEPVTIAEKITSAQLAPDRRHVLVRANDACYVLEANGKPGAAEPENTAHLDGWTFPIDPAAEWRQMYVDAWRLMRDYFYDPNLHGVDWPEVRDRYAPLVERVRTRQELGDLVAQMVGELSALHVVVAGGTSREGPERVAAAKLGARLTPVADGVRIDHIHESDPDEPERRSPLARLDLGIEPGDHIVAINGAAVGIDAPYEPLLRNQAGRQVRVRIRPARGGEERDVVVVPITPAEATDLRYHEWELTRRRRVEEASEGRIGYVHLRAMGTADIGAWARQYYGVLDRQGLVIDVRHNNGGNIDSWILSRLMRKAWMYWASRSGEPNWNMQQAFRGHVCVVMDQLTASDGEAFAEGFRRLGLGELIGMRTWGGGIWLDFANRLVDGGIASAPSSGVYAPEDGWLIEGTGVTPDIVVDNPPHATFHGADAQLDAAIEHLLERIAEDPRDVPPAPPSKDLSFPPR